MLVVLQGTCCSTQLDASGLCCLSGYVDECGVCDGDGSSCAFDIYLTATGLNGTTASAASANTSSTSEQQQQPPIPSSTSIPIGRSMDSTWQLATVAAIQQVLTKANVGTSFDVVAVWLAGPNSTSSSNDGIITGPTVPVARRRQLAAKVDTSKHLQQATAASDSPSRRSNLQTARESGMCSAGGGLGDGRTCQSAGASIDALMDLKHVGTSTVSASSKGATSSSAAGAQHGRELQQQGVPGATTGSPAAPASLLVGVRASAKNSSTSTSANLQLITLLELLSAAIAQPTPPAAEGTTAPAQPGAVALVGVQHMERMGLCGNGICEVGEQALQDSWGLHQMTTQGPCPQVRLYNGWISPSHLLTR